mgnify:CR=1 FL=1|jgi:hypothetical protein|uniref:Uncharacterized protein n=1 Tax=Haptolina ericina TaxID=156174 RepID=A0A7S3FKQ3_9EUKA|mmetsp:Transcript_71642/g.159332  ORF Transcript_71642/g.159332 Transcript_71642/m.159332 type:complete len:115 (+) Transcript_71642:989-1333(+)
MDPASRAVKSGFFLSEESVWLGSRMAGPKLENGLKQTWIDASHWWWWKSYTVNCTERFQAQMWAERAESIAAEHLRQATARISEASLGRSWRNTPTITIYLQGIVKRLKAIFSI